MSTIGHEEEWRLGIEDGEDCALARRTFALEDAYRATQDAIADTRRARLAAIAASMGETDEDRDVLQREAYAYLRMALERLERLKADDMRETTT